MIESTKITGTGTQPGGARPAGKFSGDGDAFGRLLRQEQARRQSRAMQEQARSAAANPRTVSFSRHAQQRLEKRQIGLAPDQSRKLDEAVQSAAQKGARTSLVLMDGIAFVVNVPERTVVTAMDVANGQQANSPVFTNIDSAVLA